MYIIIQHYTIYIYIHNMTELDIISIILLFIYILTREKPEIYTICMYAC